MSIACPDFIASLDPGLCRAIDHYCERTGPALDAEPVNALSNAAFLVASAAAWRLASRYPPPRGRGLIRTLIAIIAVGAGSFLFHTVGTRWAEWVDVVPILVFVLLYVWLILGLFFAWPTGRKAVAVSLLFLSSVYLEAAAPASFLWGGALYLPTILALVALAVALRRQHPPAGRAFAVAGGVFFLALTARSLDMPLCEIWPLGTHFLWHLLNAVFLYLLVRVAILYAPAAPARAAPR